MGKGVNPLKKENLGQNLFQIMLNEILECCENGISWYKNWCKTRNKKTGSCILWLFTEVPSKNLWLAFHAAWYCPLRMGRMGGSEEVFTKRSKSVKHDEINLPKIP